MVYYNTAKFQQGKEKLALFATVCETEILHVKFTIQCTKTLQQQSFSDILRDVRKRRKFCLHVFRLYGGTAFYGDGWRVFEDGTGCTLPTSCCEDDDGDI